MTRIESIRLGNFKCFEDERVPLGALTVLTGLNGSGKSTVLQALLVLQQSHLLSGNRHDASAAVAAIMPALPRHLIEQLEPQLEEITTRDETRDVTLSGSLTQLGTGKDVLCEYASSEDVTVGVRWQNNTEMVVTFNCDADASSVPLRSVSTPRGAPPRQSLRYVSSSRPAPAPYYPLVDSEGARASIMTSVEWSNSLDYLSNHGRDPVASKALLHPRVKSESLHSQTEAWLNEIAPGVRLQAYTHRELDISQLAYTFAGGRGISRPRRPNNVGYGLTYCLPILVAILSARPGTLVLVENPEVFVHPRGQSMLGRLLARAATAGVQVLLETHSDHVLNGIRVSAKERQVSASDVEVLYFERKTDRARHSIHRCRMGSNGRFGVTPPGFFDQFENDLMSLMTE